jgi:uncharacterized protein
MTLPFDRPGRRVPPPHNLPVRRAVLWLAFTLFVALVAVPWSAGFATDWLWFREIGFSQVFVTSLWWRVGLFVCSAAFVFAFIHANLLATRRAESQAPVLWVNRGDGTPLDLFRILPRIQLVAAAAIALLFGASLSALWLTFLQALHGGSVGTADPVLARDLGFYLFRLPAIDALFTAAITLTALTAVAVTVLYAIMGEIRIAPARMIVEPAAGRHVGVLIALLFVLTAFRVWIVGTSELLASTTSPSLVGANYTDVHILLPGLRLSAVAAMVAAGVVGFGGFRGRLPRYVLLSAVLYIGVSLIGRGLVPYAVQRLVVSANELNRERPYLEYHIAATRKAWGIDGVETHELSGENPLTMADIQSNGPTIDNVRLWERDLLKQTFGQLQEIRTYYDFVTVNDDRYMIDGKYRQVHLAARELNTASLPTRSFINDRLTYTHGMGITMAPVNQVTSEGLPVLFVKDLPPVSSVSLKLTRPQIYYGQLTNSYVFVGTGQKEFDSPAGETDMYTNSAGKGGVPVGSLGRRLLYAFQFGSLKILLSNDITGAARILYRRNIADRAATALPFLDFDPEPYLVVTDAGELTWMLDAYTSSANYPYAFRTDDGTSYMRNSVKVTIDAYDGTVTAYIADPNDPIVATYARIFPGAFQPLSAMPADLRRHVRYPGQLFRVQATLQARYHMLQPETFYHREDQWQIPAGNDKASTTSSYMRHIILRLPGQKSPEFIYMTPFTPQGKGNLAAWMVARMDGDNYGKLVVYQFPKQSLVYGPQQIENRINQDTDISRQLTLWDQKGSQVIRGELLVIPIEESLIYVQPIFLRAEGGSIPELKRVVVAAGNRVAMEETLDAGLATLFGGSTPARTVSAPRDTTGVRVSAAMAALLQQAREHYDRAIAAQRAGNWADYGREIEQLGAVLRALGAGPR